MPLEKASESWLMSAEPKMSEKMWEAAIAGDVDGFKLTLPAVQNIDARSDNQETSLIIASMKGHHNLVAWLLSNGADVDRVDADMRSALYYAAVNGHHDIAALLLHRDASTNQTSKLNKTPLMAAVHNRYAELSALLLTAGSEVNHQDHSGWSALFQS